MSTTTITRHSVGFVFFISVFVSAILEHRVMAQPDQSPLARFGRLWRSRQQPPLEPIFYRSQRSLHATSDFAPEAGPHWGNGIELTVKLL